MLSLEITKKHLLLILLFIVAFTERTAFDFGPNIELITMSIVISSLYIGKIQSFWLTLLLIAVTDRLIGNSSIFLFTWSGFLIPAYFVGKLAAAKTKRIENSKFFKLLFGTGLGFGTSLFFFLWTNFGVWALDSWGMYTNDLQGLFQSYINALTFFRANLISTLIFVPVGIVSADLFLSTSSLLSKRLHGSELESLHPERA